jgi:hypothetical protein
MTNEDRTAGQEPRLCQVGWAAYGNEFLFPPCGNPATHRAVSTNGRELVICHVCERCARLAEPLRYEKDNGQMLAGDPLWLIWPILTPPQPESGRGFRQAADLREVDRMSVRYKVSFDFHDDT